MIDSIKVYVKTKEAFSWPEDSEDFTPADSKASAQASSTATVVSPGTNIEGGSLQPVPLTAIDRLLASALEVLDGMFATQQQQQQQELVGFYCAFKML